MLTVVSGRSHCLWPSIAKKVYGVEIVEAAIADAKKNAALNNLDNLEFEVGNAEDWMATWQEQGSSQM